MPEHFISQDNARKLDEKLHELASAITSINHTPAHAIKVGPDHEVVYWQRREWIDWMLELSREAEALRNSVFQASLPTDNPTSQGQSNER